MTLVVRNDEEQEEDSGFDEDEQPAEHQSPTETDQDGESVSSKPGTSIEARFLKVLKAAHAKPAVLENVRREYRCADCDAHTKPQPSRKALLWTCSTFHCADNLFRFCTSFAMARISRLLPSCDKTGLPHLQWFGLLFSGHGGANLAHQTS